MNCSNCKAEFTPPKGHTITKCPFCGEPLLKVTVAEKDAMPHEILLKITKQFGRKILGESRLKGILSDMMPYTEKKYLRIFKQAVTDGVAAKLLEMGESDKESRAIKINALKENFKNHNGFNNSADYVVDCFQYALGVSEKEPEADRNQVQVNNLSVLQQSFEMAFSDGMLTKQEAQSLFSLAATLQIHEREVIALITDQIKTNKFISDGGDVFATLTKNIIVSQNWQAGSIYKAEIAEFESIQIGEQVWMKRNLNVNHFRNGDPIPEAITDEEWKKAGEEGEPAWCHYDNDPANGKIYGKLYNWHAVNDPRGLALKGWHVPSDAEWTTLIDFLGGEDIAGKKMKSQNGWDGDGNGTDEAKFSGLPGGHRDTIGSFEDVESIGNWSSSTEYSTSIAWYLNLNYFSPIVYRFDDAKGYGFSVRCVRD